MPRLTKLRLDQGIAKIFCIDNTRQYIYEKILAYDADIATIMGAQRKEAIHTYLFQYITTPIPIINTLKITIASLMFSTLSLNLLFLFCCW